ncbi:MAG: DUF885 domain-containing protein [Acidobacteriota bacterium]|nr:MAG: DUF885 domain-containing protein [Acidobacteriota bacterium]
MSHTTLSGLLVFVLNLALAMASAPAGAQNDTPQNDRLNALFEETWAFRLREDPLRATSVGEHAYDDRLPRVSVEDQRRRAEYYRGVLARLDAIDRNGDGLSASDRINYDMFRRQLADDVQEFEFKGYLLPINADSGFHMGLARLPSRVPLATVADYENYIERLKLARRYIGEHIGLMREGLRIGMTVPQVVLAGYEVTIESHVVDEARASVFFAPFESFPTSVPQAEQDRLRAAGAAAIIESVVPGYRDFLKFMTEDYIPGARDTIGASELPNGRAYYAYLVGHFTTMDLTSDEVHQIGLEEVARIRREMDAVIAEVGFEGDFAAFLTFLRTDPRFYPKSAEELLKQASFIAKKMDGMLPSLFRTLPRQPYRVAPVPDHIAPKYTAGRYVGAPLESTEPGTYWVNTFKLDSRTLYTLEALTFHEAVPGHHLQNALRQELIELPEFRRYSGIGAYGEGWGLYSERLGLEAGFYEDPYSNFGRLTYEMWRACRLVVDTGLHAKGWSRREAIDYLASHTALSLHEITTETDRYISWPGQALGYKIGELKIRELRERAEDALGKDFDVRAFHDVILLNGPVPLPVLDDLVNAWIERTAN